MLDLYKNIKKYRQERGLSQEALAKKIGYTDRSSIAKIEKGLVDLSLTKIKAFASALDVEPGELMGEAWQEEVLDNANIDVAEHLNYDAFSVAQFYQAQDLDQENTQAECYFIDPEAAQRAQEIYEDPDTRILLDAKRDLDPKDLDIVLQMIKTLKAKEGK